jgi:hypothetical protein
MHVADGEDAGTAGLQEQGLVVVELRKVMAVKVAAGEKESRTVTRQLVPEPPGVR